jgi:RHS repeat-associated protein
LDSVNGLVTQRVYGDAVDTVLSRLGSGGVESWYLSDRQGSVIGLVDGSGTAAATVSYDGYGRVSSDSAPSVGDRYRYTGRELESAAGGMVLLRDRWLALHLGVFVSPDRMGFSANDPNLTRYVKNNFPNATDPSGYVERPTGRTFEIVTAAVSCSRELSSVFIRVV